MVKMTHEKLGHAAWRTGACPYRQPPHALSYALAGFTSLTCFLFFRGVARGEDVAGVPGMNPEMDGDAIIWEKDMVMGVAR